MRVNIIHHYHLQTQEVDLELLDHHILHKVILHIVQFTSLKEIQGETINNMNKNNDIFNSIIYHVSSFTLSIILYLLLISQLK